MGTLASAIQSVLIDHIIVIPILFATPVEAYPQGNQTEALEVSTCERHLTNGAVMDLQAKSKKLRKLLRVAGAIIAHRAFPGSHFAEGPIVESDPQSPKGYRLVYRVNRGVHPTSNGRVRIALYLDREIAPIEAIDALEVNGKTLQLNSSVPSSATSLDSFTTWVTQGGTVEFGSQGATLPGDVRGTPNVYGEKRNRDIIEIELSNFDFPATESRQPLIDFDDFIK